MTQRHLELGGRAVISHFTFSPPLVAASDLGNSACFIFPINTKGSLYRADGKTEVSEGQGVLMKCGTYVNKWHGTTEDKVAEVVLLRLHPEVMQSILESEAIGKLDTFASSKKSNALVDLDVLLKKYLDGLFFYFDNRELATEELVALKIKELTLLLVNSRNPNPILELLSSLFDRESYTLHEIVDANVFEDVSLDEMAAIANMSPSTFKRKFKIEFNTTFSRYIVAKRLERANRLLRNSKASVSEIAYDCGFNDPGYFSKLFKRHYNLSPTLFRESTV